MKEKVKHIIYKFHPRAVSALLHTFLKDETISGKLILVAALLAMIVVNSPLFAAYEDIWNTKLSIGLGGWSMVEDLRHWINEGLMAFFFLVVGLEIKRELVRGELRDLRMVKLPIVAAIGGMVVPALFYYVLNPGPEVVRGWGIPIATDIAFAVGILMLFGKRVPVSLKLFLLTLAIADDIGAITVIALFYAEIIHYGYLFSSVALTLGMWLMRKRIANYLVLYMVLSLVLWFTTKQSGIHASIVGAIVGLLAPLSARVHDGRSIAERLERFFLPVSTFVALPVFAFANAGVVLSTDVFRAARSSSVMWGILLGLVVGKVVGITLATWLMVKLGQSQLPHGTRWSHIIGVGFIAGIGFTVSIFITELAFSGNLQLTEIAKISIFIASGLSALLGSVLLATSKKTTKSAQ